MTDETDVKERCEPLHAHIESSDAAASGVVALLEQTAAFMEDETGRYSILIDIEQKEAGSV